ncbi:MAG: ribonuclease HI [Candidatus Marinimicrobia bacterium]|nr:ribonuclease HI [Candidatus Neomarinimicrobiota bacterium]MCF7851517.1 ribonuclease HI [Candidatus Neomarinimicrobiota bacterium]
MAKAKKIYAIFKGHQPGLYDTWDEASAQVKGFKGAVYKSFSSREEAILWLRQCVLDEQEPVSEQLIDLIKTVDPAEKRDKRIIIHTDGGASPNPGKGGYGIVLAHGQHRKELSAGYKLTTNNRMEMMAVIVALRSLKQPSEVTLFTDSKYVVDSISKGWAKKWRSMGWRRSDGQLAENIDLWEQLLLLLDDHAVEFKWVKGHAGNKENERCDQLVEKARKSAKLLVDEGYKGKT